MFGRIFGLVYSGPVLGGGGELIFRVLRYNASIIFVQTSLPNKKSYSTCAKDIAPFMPKVLSFKLTT